MTIYIDGDWYEVMYVGEGGVLVDVGGVAKWIEL